ncbi:MAG: ATP-binding protein [Deltaproteobacteria bacterium]|nr:ATP-binding protein [Deltaproteobacteria bacterium]
MSTISKHVEMDLAPFSDIGSLLEIAEHGDRASFKLVRDGRRLVGEVSLVDGVPAYSFNAFSGKTLREVLSGSTFADLDTLTRHQASFHREVRDDFPFRNIQIDDRRGLDDHHVSELLVIPPRPRLRLLVVEGPAGIGKTRLIKRLCLSQAEAFGARRGAIPLLYVGSRGRRLSRLDDAIAASLQDVRAGNTTYAEVPSLVRNGVLALAIDEFDELSNSEGYADAWRTFRDFVDQLSDRGIVVISARDTFFDAQRFREALTSWHGRDDRVEVVEIRVAEPSWNDAKEYIRQGGADDAALTKLEDLLDPTRRAYVLRPVFLHHLRTDLAGVLEGETSFRQLIVDRFVRREADEKLACGLPPEEAPSLRRAVVRTLTEVAGDMFERDRDWVDADTLTVALDIALSDTPLTSDSQATLVARATSLGFMEPSDRGERARRFPHDEIRHWFLAGYVLEMLLTRPADTARSMLERGTVSLDFVDVFVERGSARAPAEHERLLAAVCEIARLSQVNTGLGTNARTLLAGAIRARPADVEPVEIEELTWGNASLQGARLVGEFSACTFGKLDLRGADCSQLEFKRCFVHTLLVDENSVLGCGLPASRFLRFWSHSAAEVLLADKSKIDARLQSLVATRILHKLPLINLLVRVCRRSIGQFYLAEDGHDEVSGDIISDPLWQTLRDILVSHNRLESRVKSTGGPRKLLLHVRDPASLLSGRHADPEQHAQLEALWTEVRDKALPAA